MPTLNTTAIQNAAEIFYVLQLSGTAAVKKKKKKVFLSGSFSWRVEDSDVHVQTLMYLLTVVWVIYLSAWWLPLIFSSLMKCKGCFVCLNTFIVLLKYSFPGRPYDPGCCDSLHNLPPRQCWQNNSVVRITPWGTPRVTDSGRYLLRATIVLIRHDYNSDACVEVSYRQQNTH